METPINQEVILSDVKIDLGITDDIQDDVINGLIRKVLAHFYLEYENEPLERHAFIIEEAVIKRFNRRGAEGVEHQSEEGLSNKYADEDEFADYDHRIRKDFGIPYPAIGGVQFL